MSTGPFTDPNGWLARACAEAPKRLALIDTDEDGTAQAYEAMREEHPERFADAPAVEPPTAAQYAEACAVLEWIEHNEPGGIAIVARAMVGIPMNLKVASVKERLEARKTVKR